jgi:hypothetical protein
MIEMYMWNLIQDCHGKNSIQQESDPFHQQTGHIVKEEARRLLYLKHSFFWCCILDASDSK